jgi:hypothetical protein
MMVAPAPAASSLATCCLVFSHQRRSQPLQLCAASLQRHQQRRAGQKQALRNQQTAASGARSPVCCPANLGPHHVQPQAGWAGQGARGQGHPAGWRKGTSAAGQQHTGPGLGLMQSTTMPATQQALPVMSCASGCLPAAARMTVALPAPHAASQDLPDPPDPPAASIQLLLMTLILCPSGRRLQRQLAVQQHCAALLSHHAHAAGGAQQPGQILADG